MSYSDNSTVTNEKTPKDCFEITSEDSRESFDDVVEINLSNEMGDLYINKGGDYMLSGVFDHTIVIDAKEHLVHLFLNGVEIKAEHDNAIYVKSASKLVITCISETNNTICDGVYYNDSDELACLFCESDLTINGSGNLSIVGKNDDAIHSKDNIKLLNTNCYVGAKGNGIKGNDGILISGCNLQVEAEKSGLMTSHNEKNKGEIQIDNSTITIIAGIYGISAKSDIIINSGEVSTKGIIGNVDCDGNIFVDDEAVVYD